MKTIGDVHTFTPDTANALRWADHHGWQRQEITVVFRILRSRHIAPTITALQLVDRIAGMANVERIEAARKADPQ